MKLHEALAVIKDDEWMRPKDWIGHGTAYCVQNGVIREIFKNNRPHIYPFVDSLIGDWEIVSPDEVLNERKRDISQQVV